MKNYILMLEDAPVVSISFDDMETYVWNRALLPYSIRNKIIIPNEDNKKNPMDYYKIMAKNIEYIKSFAASRVLSLSRDNAKQIYTACQISQDNSIDNRVKICLLCKGISINDGYWFKEEQSKDNWKDVDIKQNHLYEIIDIALEGKQPTATTSAMCPELTTKGLFRKAWIRENDKLYLLKSDKLKNFENTKAEVIASEILDCTDIKHVHYDLKRYNNLLVAKSENFTPDGQSFVEAHEFIEYCKDTNIDYVKYCLSKFGKDFANIPVIDFLIQNTDRHDQNYGFLMDNKTGELLAVAPLFDHNQALIADWIKKDVTNTLSQMLPESLTIKEAAEKFKKYANIIIDIDKWNILKDKYPKYNGTFKNVERRMMEIKDALYVKDNQKEEIKELE